jgi:ER-bound oxygenase mpaB/B'/Rubber oxygenase, catalytic domain
MHLSRDPSWRGEDWGVPINQADMALTALLFSHGFVEFVRKLGVHVTAEEEEDLVHLWRYVGYLMGVREELLCATVNEAKQLAELVDLVDAGPDEDSRRLLDPLLERRPNELRVRSERMGRVVRRLFSAACRDMIGDDYANRVGLPYGPGDLGFRYVFRPAISLLSRAQERIPGAAARSRRAGERYWAAVTGR